MGHGSKGKLKEWVPFWVFCSSNFLDSNKLAKVSCSFMDEKSKEMWDLEIVMKDLEDNVYKY